jgi:hypothetical protein
MRGLLCVVCCSGGNKVAEEHKSTPPPGKVQSKGQFRWRLRHVRQPSRVSSIDWPYFIYIYILFIFTSHRVKNNCLYIGTFLRVHVFPYSESLTSCDALIFKLMLSRGDAPQPRE